LFAQRHGESFSRCGWWSRFQRDKAASLVSAKRNGSVGDDRSVTNLVHARDAREILPPQHALELKTVGKFGGHKKQNLSVVWSKSENCALVYVQQRLCSSVNVSVSSLNQGAIRARTHKLKNIGKFAVRFKSENCGNILNITSNSSVRIVDSIKVSIARLGYFPRWTLKIFICATDFSQRAEFAI
jgi:hypothetical protein